MERHEVDGIHLNVAVTGEGPALLTLHGFTGSHETWRPFSAALGRFTIIAPDIIGHGASDSPDNPQRYRMGRFVPDLCTLLDRLGIGETAVLGYSMGGRVALHMALLAPERVRALVLESASPGIEDLCERAERVQSDERLAEAIEGDGIEAFVDQWESLPLFATQRRLPDEVRRRLREQRLRNEAVGLANSLRGMGAGAQAPLASRLAEIRAPALLLAGSLDEKYAALAERMAAELPNGRAEILPDTGHAPHLERPDLFCQAVRRFLEGCAT